MQQDKATGALVPASEPHEVEERYSELNAKGVEFSEELTSTNWGKCAFLSDPDGNEFEIS